MHAVFIKKFQRLVLITIIEEAIIAGVGCRILKTGILKTGSYEQERTKRGMCKSGGINLTGNGFWSDKVSVSFVVRSDRDLAFVTISL